MFSWLFRRKPVGKVVVQPIGEVFDWPKETILTPCDRLIFAVPSASVGDDETFGDIIHCNDDANFAMPESDDKIYIQLESGMSIWLSRSVQAIVLGCDDDDLSAKRIRVTSDSDDTN